MDRRRQETLWLQAHARYPLVLVVDDDPDARAVARRHVEAARFRVAEAEDGHHALERFEALAPDIVLMDGRMPGLDGFQATRALRRRPHGAHTPVLLTTSQVDDAALERAFDAGASEVLAKPLHRTLVQNRLRLLYENRLAHEALRAAEQRNRQLVDQSPEGVVVVLEGRFFYINRAGVDCLGGANPGAFAGRSLLEFVEPGQVEPARRYLQAVAGGERAGERIETRLVGVDGGVREVEFTATPYEYYGHATVLAHIHDITLRKEAEREARLAAQVVESTTEGVLVTDAGNRIVSVNPAFTRVTGYTAEEAVGETPALLNSGRHDAAFYEGMWRAIRDHGEWQGEIWNRRKNGEIYPEWLNVTVVRDDAGRITHHIAVFSDITAIKKAEARLHRLAHYDPLTGLANRALFLERLEQSLMQAERTGERFAVLFIDLDRFKAVNDSLGHRAGDQLLEEVARRLEGCLRKSDTVARLGGDEFTALLRHIHSRRDVEELAATIVEVLERPFQLPGGTVQVGSSIGVALYPEAGADVDTLTQRADNAMYRAKEAGRNTYRFDSDGPAVECAVDEAELRRALEHEELALAYQPYYGRDGAIAGFEALLRWHHPQRGELPPAQFLPLAEESDLGVAIGQWVLERACTQAGQWNAARPERPERPLGLTVNLSRRQLVDPRFAEEVGRVLARTGLPAHLLGLDAAESILLGDLAPLMDNLAGLRALGVRVAVDDFGGGFAALERLRELPLDAIKIDRAFIGRLSEGARDQAIAESMIELAHRLQMEVCAEGVETSEQLAFLQAHHCDLTQGYYLHRPATAAEVETLLARDR